MPIEREEFVHLHLHTEYSLLDGASRIDRLMQYVKSLGQTAVAITDHGVMYGCVDFYKAAKKHGIKPIIGCEVYVAERTRLDKVHRLDSSPYHLVLLCKNETGYFNLLKLVSRAHIEGFYNRPRVDRELLSQYHEGLIALSACIAGEVPRNLLSGEYDSAKEAALWYRELFGEEDYYIEIQDHGLSEQRRILPELIRLSEETGIPLAATNDCHYIAREDSEMQRALICIQTNKTMDDDDVLEFKTSEFYVKSTGEMEALFPSVPKAVTNTAKIAGRCDFDFEFGVTKLPYFRTPDGSDNEEYFRRLCEEGLVRRRGEHPEPDYRSRMEYEMDVIIRMGYTDYFLIVGDFIDFARKNDIPVGPGRGSGAGSLTAYCLGITGVDPIRYNLLFERFLNPERVSMPDFDIDFCYEKRQLVIDYVVKKYGDDHVVQIITFGTMAARAAVRDIGRALGVQYQRVDTVAKMIPFMPGITIETALHRSAELKGLYDGDAEVRKLLDLSMKVEGMPRHASTHAAGVVITRDEAIGYVPLQKNDEQIVTQYPMNTLEELGLLKMDFLGLRTLTVISDTEKAVQKTADPAFSAEEIPFDDRGVYEMLSAGHTSGLFQFESGGMRQALMGLKPVSIEDLIAVISLYRPGPMDSIPTYIRNRHHPEGITYKTPLLEPILNVTNGCIVYQEQVMQIFRDLAGFSYGQADIVRRAMSKKKADVMEQEGRRFIYGSDESGKECDGCVKRGIPETVAKEIFAAMESFASYAFNKSHAAAYAVVAYRTAYLKRYYPKEFMAALLTSVLDSTDRIIEYIGECQRIGIEVAPPGINESESGFTVSGGGKILFGLRAVKNVGRNLIYAIVEERQKHGNYRSFPDFCKRVHGAEVNKRALENLIRSGAFDGMGLSRRAMAEATDEILRSIDSDERRNIEGQMNLFETAGHSGEDYDLQDCSEYDRQALLAYEKEVTGLYLSSHPLKEYGELTARVSSTAVRELLADDAGRLDNRNIELVCSVANLKPKITKSNATMAFVTLEDLTGSIEMLVFPAQLDRYARFLQINAVVVVNARVSVKEDENVSLVCNAVTPAEEYTAQNGGRARPAGADSEPKDAAGRELYLKVKEKDSPEFLRACSALQIFDGPVPVKFYFTEQKQLVRAPRKMWVALSEPLLGALRDILGAENVALK